MCQATPASCHVSCYTSAKSHVCHDPRYAADSLGDVVFAQLPREAEEVGLGAECGAVESVKAASDLYSPVTGTVIRHNTQVRHLTYEINELLILCEIFVNEAIAII